LKLLIKGTWRIASVAGIDINIHWSFSFVILWMILHSAFTGQAWQSIIFVSVAMLLLFGCVALHELGHALTARWLDVEVKNILILPVGGLVQIQSSPDKPLSDFLIAAAGPLVNLVITFGTVSILIVLGEIRLLFGFLISPITVLEAIAGSPFRQEIIVGLVVFLLLVNAILFIFNLIPAFPMDGGRILRASLALVMPYRQATRLARGLGRLVAILMLMAAFSLRSWELLFVGGLVLVTAYFMRIE